MNGEGAAGFWSYAHEDDKSDSGAIVQLAHLIMEEYSLLSGEPLELFIDCDSIAWGQEWRKRIDTSLAQTTFFIPIVTPRYFKRPECRRELLEFAAKAKSLGVADLLLPLIYIEMPDLSPENPDEAVVLVANTQYVDWHTNRLLEPTSREYRTAINKLASRLLEIAREVAESQLSRELDSNPEDNGVDGIADLVEKITALLPDWLDAVMSHKTTYAQMAATYEQHLDQLDKLRKRKAPMSAVLATRIRLTKEMLPLAERQLRDTSIYLTRSVELDPFMSSLTRILAQHPDGLPLITPIKEAVDEAMIEIRQQDERLAKGKIELWQYFDRLAHLGRSFQQCRSILVEGQRYGLEGNDIVRRWDAELSSLV